MGILEKTLSNVVAALIDLIRKYSKSNICEIVNGSYDVVAAIRQCRRSWVDAKVSHFP